MELGSAHVKSHGGPYEEEAYLTALTARIQDHVKSRGEVGDLIQTGESATEPRLIQIFKNAISKQSSTHVIKRLEDISPYMGTEALYATCNGAAEFAKRKQEGMGWCRIPDGLF